MDRTVQIFEHGPLRGWLASVEATQGAEDHPGLAAEGKQAAQPDQNVVPFGAVQTVEHGQHILVGDLP